MRSRVRVRLLERPSVRFSGAEVRRVPGLSGRLGRGRVSVSGIRLPGIGRVPAGRAAQMRQESRLQGRVERRAGTGFFSPGSIALHIRDLF